MKFLLNMKTINCGSNFDYDWWFLRRYLFCAGSKIRRCTLSV